MYFWAEPLNCVMSEETHSIGHWKQGTQTILKTFQMYEYFNKLINYSNNSKVIVINAEQYSVVQMKLQTALHNWNQLYASISEELIG